MPRRRLQSLAIAALLFAFLFSVRLSAQPQAPRISTEDEIKADLMLAPCKSKERADAVVNLLKSIGVKENEISSEEVKDVRNISVTKKGKVDETIIIGAHYDKVGDGCGAIDNWTGVVIVSHLLRTLRSVSTQKTYIVVAFDKEESGLVGSRQMAKAIPKENRASYCSMVNLDSFGFTYPQVLGNASDSNMTELAKSLAKDVGMPFSVSNLAGVADADSSSFLDKDIPAITFHGMSDKWQQYLHSSNDKLENVKPSSVRVGYNFVLEYIKKLDSRPCGEFRK